jgi:tRNA threonylcarbamoyladenosine biosynthesis protein TsaB
MRLLALDTTTRAGSVAIVDDDRVLAEREGNAARSHTERLPQEILDALADAGLDVAAIDVFAVASGPGSFTGLRIGIATIQGMAMAAGKPVVPVSALEALAAQAASGAADGTLVGAWMDAGRRDVFSALYAVDRSAPAGCVVREAASVDAPATVWRSWRDAGQAPSVMIGDGAGLYADVFTGTAIIVPHGPLAVTLAQLARAVAARGEASHPAAVHPVYVRRPDVEITRDAQAHAAARGSSEPG